MKITGNEALFKQALAGQTGKPQNPVKGTFGALLKEAAGTETDQAGQGTSLQGPGSIRGVSLNPLFDAKPVSLPDRVENFLNRLDNYRDMLADPAVSLKEIGPVMQELSIEKESLQQVLGSLPEGDGLSEILNQVLVAASLEEIKFNKGDYNPA